MKVEKTTTEWNIITDKINIKSKYKIPDDAELQDWTFNFNKDTMELEVSITYSKEIKEV